MAFGLAAVPVCAIRVPGQIKFVLRWSQEMRLPLVILHVGAGTLAMLAGALAKSFRKGSREHRRAGNVFVICMLTVSALGSYLGVIKGEMEQFHGWHLRLLSGGNSVGDR